MTDVLGAAIWDYQHKKTGSKLWIHNPYGRKEEMPVEVYFRTVDEMPEMERLALQLCRGKVLDVGAGAGAHSLALQQLGIDVTAIDISPKAVEVAQQRGVQMIAQADIFQYKSSKFDTLLLLMNGIGLTGTLAGLQRFLLHAKTLVKKSGQLIFDSSDIAYLYKNISKPADKYYGEIVYQYEYQKEKTEPFSWLYVDRTTLGEIAASAGWQTEIILEDAYDQYLARLTQKSK
jgi:SAM-dependent methyltransferase